MMLLSRLRVGEAANTIAQANKLRLSLDGSKLPGHQSNLMAVLLCIRESELILFLGTSLVAIKANRFLYVALFIIITHILYGIIISSYSLKGINTGFAIGFIADLIAGIFFYVYTKHSLTKKPDDHAQRLKHKISKWLYGLLCLAMIYTIGIVYLGVQKGREITARVNAERPIHTDENTKSIQSKQTQEDTGFGVIRDPMLWNSESGKPTHSNSERR